MSIPLVLIEIDKDSRLHVYQHEGVRVALVDQRADPQIVVLPEADQMLEIEAVIHRDGWPEIPILTLRCDDGIKTASEVVRRLDEGRIVVAEFAR